MSGWGRTAPTAATGASRSTAPTTWPPPSSQAGPRGLIARGLGRSYGDAAQNAGGDVIVTTGLDRILARRHRRTGRARVQAGVSLDRLMRTLVPLGLWPMVTPGTRQVTVGGAIGSDVHGKNHHRDGTFTTHVESMVLETPALGTADRRVPDQDPDLFWATAGGMGLTGLIAEATIRLLPVETALDAGRQRTGARPRRRHGPDGRGGPAVPLQRELDRLPGPGPLARPVGARVRRPRPRWTISRPDRRDPGRGPFASARSTGAQAPPWAPSGLLNRWTVAAFNEVWYRKSPRRQHGPPGAGGRLLPSPRRRRRAGTGSTAVAASSSTRWWFLTAPRRRCGGRRGAERGPVRLVPGRAQALRGGQSGAAVVPAVGLDARPRPAGGCRRAGAAAGRPRRAWSWPPAAGSTWPRTPGCDPNCSRPCTPSCPPGGPCGIDWIPTAGCARTWPAACPACSILPTRGGPPG